MRCTFLPTWLRPVLLFLVIGMGLTAGATPAHSAEAKTKPARPNIVFLLCDDLGYGDLGCFGHPAIKTPNLDKLAGEGMKLTHCYAAAPVCSPSRAGIMTGRIPNRLGISDWIPAGSGIFLKNNEITVARLLKSAGYRTALAGKWHLNSKMDGSEPTPGGHGFDYWFATQNNAAPSHENPVNFVRNGKPAGPLKGNSSTLIVNEAITFLKGVKDKPFALFVCFHAPHEPVAVTNAWTQRYAKVEPANKRIYYGSVGLMDHEAGRLLRTLDDFKLRDNTLVLFTSDNGPETLNRYRGAERSYGSPGPLRGMKLHLHEGGYRVPGIIRWPGKIRAGQVCTEPVNGTDVLPTLCTVAGVKIPADRPIDGVSILPLFEGKSVVRKTPLYWQYDRAIGGQWKVALRQRWWKLLGNAALNRFALYDLQHDPGEKHDLAADQLDRVKDLARQMTRLHREVNGKVKAKP